MSAYEFVPCYIAFCETICLANPSCTCSRDNLDAEMIVYDADENSIIDETEF